MGGFFIIVVTAIAASILFVFVLVDRYREFFHPLTLLIGKIILVYFIPVLFAKLIVLPDAADSLWWESSDDHLGAYIILFSLACVITSAILANYLVTNRYSSAHIELYIAPKSVYLICLISLCAFIVIVMDKVLNYELSNILTVIASKWIWFISIPIAGFLFVVEKKINPIIIMLVVFICVASLYLKNRQGALLDFIAIISILLLLRIGFRINVHRFVLFGAFFASLLIVVKFSEIFPQFLQKYQETDSFPDIKQYLIGFLTRDLGRYEALSLAIRQGQDIDIPVWFLMLKNVPFYTFIPGAESFAIELVENTRLLFRGQYIIGVTPQLTPLGEVWIAGGFGMVIFNSIVIGMIVGSLSGILRRRGNEVNGVIACVLCYFVSVNSLLGMLSFKPFFSVILVLFFFGKIDATLYRLR